MNQIGLIKRIGATEQVKDTFKKRELILTVPGQYEQTLKFEAVQDRVSLLDGLIVGQNVNVHFSLEGNDTAKGCFNTLKIWKLELA
jgi:hypothetical protein